MCAAGMTNRVMPADVRERLIANRPRPERPAVRLQRVLTIMRLIQSEPLQHTRGSLCALTGVSPRQLDEDLHALRAAGINIRRHHSGYSIDDLPLADRRS